ncbi:MAG: helix-turn-helix domain-containing protein, partial [Saprospiraceae bacterium]|nr:helix-turn-helix domain-containing protein [Saprospiraceae bacterium]
AVLVLLLRIPFYFFPYETQMTIIRASVPRSTNPLMWLWLRIHWSFVKLIMYHMILYIPIIWLYLRSRKKKFDASKANGSGVIQKRWYNILFVLYIGYVMGYVFYYLLLLTGNYTLFYDYSISLAMAVFVFVVGFLGYQQPKIFSGEILQQVFLPSKYQNSTMTAQAADSLLQKLLEYMELEKPYRNNELRLTMLAEALDVPSYHLSQAINQKLGQSFAHFINTYRLKDVQGMLHNPEYADVPILQIAYEAGFNNRTTFYKAFKEHFGVLPTEYKQQANSNGKS